MQVGRQAHEKAQEEFKAWCITIAEDLEHYGDFGSKGGRYKIAVTLFRYSHACLKKPSYVNAYKFLVRRGEKMQVKLSYNAFCDDRPVPKVSRLARCMMQPYL